MSMACDYCGGDIRSDCHAGDVELVSRISADLERTRSQLQWYEHQHAALLEALEELLAACGLCGWDAEVKKARAAIAAAKGDK